MNQITITSLSQYIDTIKRLRSYYPSGIFVDNPTSHHFLYRGHSDATYQLLPGIYRKTFSETGLFHVNNDGYLAWSTERGILRAFKQEASHILNILPENELKWAEYAQHYGVPTRFLDWSANPLVALYFACKNKNSADGVVWLLHAQNYKNFLSKHTTSEDLQGEKGNITIKGIITEMLSGNAISEFPLLYTPYYVDARMSAQNSYFLVWGSKQIPLEDMIAGEDLLMNLPETDNGIRAFGESQRSDLLFKFWLSALLSRCFVGAALIRPKADEPPGLRSKQSPGGRSSPLSCLGTLRIFRTALISEVCWICLRQIAFVPNAGLLTLAGKSSPYGVFAE